MSSGHINEVRARRLDDRPLARETRPTAERRARDIVSRVSDARASSRAPSRPASGSRPRRKCLNPKNLKRRGASRRASFLFFRGPELTPPVPPPLLSRRPAAVGISRTPRTSRSASSPPPARRRGPSRAPRLRRSRRRSRRRSTPAAAARVGVSAAATTERCRSAAPRANRRVGCV